jgi:predicted nucleotidyltransferase
MLVELLSFAGLKIFKLNYELVFKKLREYAERIVKENRALVVFLIGSLARGDYTAFSDADIVIIVHDNYPKKLPERIVDFMDSTLPLDIEPRVYTVSEFRKLVDSNARIVREIIEYGVLLAGNEKHSKRCIKNKKT